MKLNNSNNSLSDMIELHKIQLKLEKTGNNCDIRERIEDLQIILEYKTKLRSKNGIARVLYDLGIDYYIIGEHQSAVKSHLQLLEMLNSLENTALKVELYQSLKNFYKDKDLTNISEIKKKLMQ